MKVLQYTAPRQARIIERETPVATGRSSLARTIVTGISAGTEMGFYRGTSPQMHADTDASGLFRVKPNAISYPMASSDPGVWWMGYAAVGRVEQPGPEEKALKPGDLVFGMLGHKDWMLWDGFQKLPPETIPAHATFLTLLMVAYNGLLDARVQLLDEVVIFGMGTLGQLLLQLCKLAGASVTAIDYLPSRLELARALGADVVFNPGKDGDPGVFVQERTKRRGADIVFEVSGNVQALPDAIRCAGFDGQVTVLSFYQGGSEPLQLGREFHHRRTTLRSSQIGGINPELGPRYDAARRTEAVIRLLPKLKLDPLISHRVQFDRLPEALTLIDENPSACQAVVVDY